MLFTYIWVPSFFSQKIPGLVQVKIAILQILVQTSVAPKGRCQKHSKIVEAQNLKTKLFQYKIKMLYIFNIPSFIHVFYEISCFGQVFTILGANSRLFLDLDR